MESVDVFCLALTLVGSDDVFVLLLLLGNQMMCCLAITLGESDGAFCLAITL